MVLTRMLCLLTHCFLGPGRRPAESATSARGSDVSGSDIELQEELGVLHGVTIKRRGLKKS